jgi:hypothetical protein
MTRSLFLALFAVAAAIAGEIGARQAIVLNEQRVVATAARVTEARKTHEINVPRIKDGGVKGYAVMLLSYTVDVGALKTAEMAPDSILVDEAFRQDEQGADPFGQRAGEGRGAAGRRRAGIHLRHHRRHPCAAVRRAGLVQTAYSSCNFTQLIGNGRPSS